MLTRYVKSFYANLFINAANELGLKHEVIDDEISLIRIHAEDKEFLMKGCCSQFNNAIGRCFAKNKNLTLKYLRQHKLPAPKFKKFKNFKRALDYALNCLDEIVIKPSNASLALGITVKPNGKAQIEKALKQAFKVNDVIMIEEYLPGKDYRITVFKGKIIAVTYRAPGHVIGNGKSNLQTLIEEKNKKRQLQEKPLIILREKDLEHLDNNNLDLHYVPEDGEFVRLQLGCDRDIGGDRHRIELADVHPDNLELFSKIAKLLKLNYCGIDFIIPDITKSYKTQTCGVNEVNSSPHQDVHYYDTTKGDNYSCRKILKLHFGLV